MSARVLQNHRSNVVPAVAIQRVESSAPSDWLGAVTRNLGAAPRPRFLQGALFGAAGAVTLSAAWVMPGFTVALLTGLLLVGSALAAGLCVVARRQDAGERFSVSAAPAFLRTRSTNPALFGVFLALVSAAWDTPPLPERATGRFD